MAGKVDQGMASSFYSATCCVKLFINISINQINYSKIYLKQTISAQYTGQYSNQYDSAIYEKTSVKTQCPKCSIVYKFIG